jgi:hypothetical protein
MGRGSRRRRPEAASAARSRGDALFRVSGVRTVASPHRLRRSPSAVRAAVGSSHPVLPFRSRGRAPLLSFSPPTETAGDRPSGPPPDPDLAPRGAWPHPVSVRRSSPDLLPSAHAESGIRGSRAHRARPRSASRVSHPLSGFLPPILPGLFHPGGAPGVSPSGPCSSRAAVTRGPCSRVPSSPAVRPRPGARPRGRRRWDASAPEASSSRESGLSPRRAVKRGGGPEPSWRSSRAGVRPRSSRRRVKPASPPGESRATALRRAGGRRALVSGVRRASGADIPAKGHPARSEVFPSPLSIRRSLDPTSRSARPSRRRRG